MIVYTCVNHSPEQALLFLGKSKFTINEFTKNTEEVILFKTFTEFVKNLHRVNLKKYKYKIGIVFCSVLEDYNLKGVYRLDSNGPETTNPHLDFQNLDVRPKRVVFEERSIIEDKIVQIKKGSLLNPLMSYIYTLSSLFQKSVKFICCGYIYFGGTWQELEQAVALAERNNEQKLSKKAKERLYEIARSKPAKEHRKAFSRIRNKKPLSGLKVNNYEINYITAAINTGDEYVEFFRNSN